MTTTLITGANKGLGFETARRLVAAGHTVYVGARDARRGGEAVERLNAGAGRLNAGDGVGRGRLNVDGGAGGLDAGGGAGGSGDGHAREAGRGEARSVLIDVTDDDSVQAAVAVVREQAGRLDVLVNNAGIAGPGEPVGEITVPDIRMVYETNVFGVVRVTRAFLPLLESGDAPVVVNVGSGLGSLAVTTDPGRLESTIPALAYASSKAALNMITSQYAKAYPKIRINVVDPGYTATDFNAHSGVQTVEEGAEVIVRMALIGMDGPTGGYFDAAGPVPW
ncbi:SDR family NAD(P)-dependent oxidoreductase [Streptosporangium sp. NBC_01469]|uniref:SDR family NAD(P)-dependent oxidoreductase n=1 Tax=Streptosporangium sp. NBC_01469 TaxID=2903898 RepID=UPI002E28BAF2|nr:SDR family NAD(P)-dependent oxidoreductase [Streptosporangium sp. NBC_01469]